MTKVTLIIGSTRQNRNADPVAEWVKAQVAKNPDVELSVLDLKAEALPFFESPVPPAYVPDATEHGKAWAAKIGESERFIFLTSEYNRSIPASLKNGIDYLVAEWNGKPAAIVSYGFVDGGGSATSHLKDILGWVKMKINTTNVALPLSQDIMNDSGTVADPHAAFADHADEFAATLAELVAA